MEREGEGEGEEKKENGEKGRGNHISSFSPRLIPLGQGLASPATPVN